jgi:hypothetical protein
VTPYLLGGNKVLRGFGEIPLEVRVTDHLVQAGASVGMTKQGLGEEDDERLAEVAMDLATQHMELQMVKSDRMAGLVERDHSRS